MKKVNKNSRKKNILLYMILLMSIFSLREFVVDFYKVNGMSMYPTLNDNQFVVGYKVNQQYERGDIVIVHSEQYGYLIKRIIGLPNERLAIDNGLVTIDGIELKENYLNNGMNKGPVYTGEILLGPDSYYIMGDNRDNSSDSRDFGPVDKESIIATAFSK